MGLFDKPVKRGCQPFNWLIDGLAYRMKLNKGVVDAEDQPILAPIRGVHEFREDFAAPYNSSEWDSYNTDGGGDSSEVCTVNDGKGGELTLTTNDSSSDAEQRQYVTESFKLDSGKLWFEARAKIDGSTNGELALGLIADEDLTGVSDLFPADGVVFANNAGDDEEIDVNSSKDGTDDGASNVGTLDTEYHRYCLYFDGSGKVEAYLDGELVATLDTTICDDEELTPVVLVRTQEAATHTLTVDYIRVVQER